MHKSAYQTIAAPCEHCYEEKKSRFIAQLWPETNKDTALANLVQVKQSHPDARHYCWAYIIGDPEQVLSAGCNDDGEPSGTAGKPMLNVLMKRKVGDVIAVVTRYFGGVKLGAGGLTRAYGQAVSGALDRVKITLVIPKTHLEVIVDYPLEDSIRNILQQFDADNFTAEYQEKVILHCDIAICDLKMLRELLINRTSGKISIRDYGR